MSMTYILIDCSLSRTFKWRDKDSLYHSTAFLNQVLFTAKVMPGEIIGIFLSNESALSVFIARAYDILRFSTISEIKK